MKSNKELEEIADIKVNSYLNEKYRGYEITFID